jgi:hypothetical protein
MIQISALNEAARYLLPRVKGVWQAIRLVLLPLPFEFITTEVAQCRITTAPVVEDLDPVECGRSEHVALPTQVGFFGEACPERSRREDCGFFQDLSLFTQDAVLAS